MNIYIIVKSILVTALLIAGFGIFTIRVRRLLKIMKSVQGKTQIKIDRLAERIKVLLIDVLGQSNVRRKLMPGLAHTLIFFGFLAVQPHSVELMINGVCPAFHAANFIPGIYGVYLFIADILAFFVLIGLGYALYRRLFIKPKYLTDALDARLMVDGEVRLQGRPRELIAAEFEQMKELKITLRQRPDSGGVSMLQDLDLRPAKGQITWTGPVDGDLAHVGELTTRLEHAGLETSEVQVREPRLEGVLLRLTGEELHP